MPNILLNTGSGVGLKRVANSEIYKVLKVSIRTIDWVKKAFREKKGLNPVLDASQRHVFYDKKVDAMRKHTYSTV